MKVKCNSGFGSCVRYVGKVIEWLRQEFVGKYFIIILVLVVELVYGVKLKE